MKPRRGREALVLMFFSQMFRYLQCADKMERLSFAFILFALDGCLFKGNFPRGHLRCEVEEMM